MRLFEAALRFGHLLRINIQVDHGPRANPSEPIGEEHLEPGILASQRSYRSGLKIDPDYLSGGRGYPERIFAAVAVLFGCLLFVTNPIQEEYTTWLKRQMTDAGSGAVDKAVITFLAGPIIDMSTTRTDFVLFSVYHTDAGTGAKITVVGLLHRFVPVPYSAVAPAPHTVPGPASGRSQPDDGYVWITDEPGDLRVRWNPGQPSVAHPHTIAAATEGHWLPEDGYSWVIDPPPPGDLRVRWTPGKLSSLHPHTVAATAEGRWSPQNGYAWLVDPPTPGDFRVHWAPGTRSANYQHVVAAPEPERWLPEDGYVWNINPPPPTNLAVHWAPGQLSAKYSHVITGEIEGSWRPQPGFVWINDPPAPGDFRVRAAVGYEPSPAN